jgi:hypothetical protein
VNPTRSQKRAVTRRRSSWGAGAGTTGESSGLDVSCSERALDQATGNGAPEGGAPVVGNALAHSLQNFAVGPAAAPPEGQVRESAEEPHSVQNLLPGGLGAPHAEHAIVLIVPQW